MSSETVASGARARTRRAILDAAVLVLSQNYSASLGDIAASAGIGRTTLHRYFPERGDLLAGLSEHVLERIALATDRAALGDGPAPLALDRLCREYFELGDILMFMFAAEPESVNGNEWREPTPADAALYRLVERGHAEGSIDRIVSPQWVQQILWAMLFAAWQYSREDCVPKHQALEMCLHSLRKAVST
jgi:AcrR family transcriptional regulator